jgi:hypothetical protein
MALTSGFFPSVNGDRKQTGSFLAQWIHSLISNGVLDGDFAVAAGANMSVILPVGQAWINGYYCRNDANVTLPIANADGILKRKDTVVLRWDINTRDITVQVLTGTLSSSPIAPAVVRGAEQYDLKLAEISIAAGTTVITQAMITDTRLDSTVCGFVTQMIKTIDTTTLFNQLQAYMTEHEAQFTAHMAAFEAQFGTDVNTWFNGIKDILDESTAATLLNMINTVSSNLSAHAADTTAHMTAAQKTTLTAALQSATLGGAAVPKSGTTLQLPAYPTSLPANGGTSAACSGNAATAGTANYAHYSSHAVGSGGAALRNITMSTIAPSGGQDGDVFHQYK